MSSRTGGLERVGNVDIAETVTTSLTLSALY